MTDTVLTLTITGSAAVIAQALAALNGTQDVKLTVPDEPLDNVAPWAPPPADPVFVQPVSEPTTIPTAVASIPPMPMAPVAPAASAVEVDADGVAWNADLHAATKAKTADGRWRKKRGAGAASEASAPAAAIPPMPMGDNAPVPAPASAMPLPTPGVEPAPLPVNVTPLVRSQPDGFVQGANVAAGTPPALPVGGPLAAITPADFLKQLLVPAINAAKARGEQLAVGEVMAEVGQLIGVGDLSSPAQLSGYDSGIIQIAYDTTKQLLVSRGLLA